MRSLVVATAVLLSAAGSAPAQSNLADRILGVRDGTVRLAYNVREGICGDGESFIRDRTRGENNYITFESTSRTRGRNWREWPCEPGPARVAISKSGGLITRVRVVVGGAWATAGSDVVDLGEVAAPAAAKALIALAARERRAEKALFAATIADSVEIWPDLLALARNVEVAKDTRKSAVFWLSQTVSDAATQGLSELAESEAQDREIRDQAVFALSQLPDEQGIPVLIRLAKTNRDPQVRRKAIFWLGQSEDPRVLALFEEILTKR
jgi:hypothetical protein